MRVFIIFLISIVGVSCSSSTPKKQDSSLNDEMFKVAQKIVCDIKYPNFLKICQCRADVIYEITPPELRRNAMNDRREVINIVLIMIENQEQLDACGKLPSSKDRGAALTE